MMLLDGERRVRKVNKFAEQFAGACTSDLNGRAAAKRCAVFIHRTTPKACGFGPQCGQCPVRRTVIATFKPAACISRWKRPCRSSSPGKSKKLPFSFPPHYSKFRNNPGFWSRFKTLPCACRLRRLCKGLTTNWKSGGGTHRGLKQTVEQLQEEVMERQRAENILRARLRLLELAESYSQEEFPPGDPGRIGGAHRQHHRLYHLVEADQRTLSLQSWSTNTLKNMCTAEGKGRHYDLAEPASGRIACLSAVRLFTTTMPRCPEPGIASRPCSGGAGTGGADL